ncbi:MAG: RpiB/LacA/LacB family sugar-phosphate isomerase [Opitutales bacterium]|nr:RpiB/LacA/LacB family sugar-phosphate isomerase [Opitutales bacterium]
MKIAVGSDPNAVELKKSICNILTDHEVVDFGSDDPLYANVAVDVAKTVASGKFDRGILLCGTGLGVSLAANKVKGAYATPCTNVYSAERSILSNNANILTIGSLVTGSELAKKIVKTWISCIYESGGRSETKVQCIRDHEKTLMSQG